MSRIAYQLNFSNCLKAIPLALAILIMSLSSNNPVFAQEAVQAESRMLRTLTVTGRGLEMVPTTITQVQLGVEVSGKTAREVQQEAARRSAAVVEFLRSRNVEKLQTTGIRLNPNYSFENNVQRLTGYTASNTVSFRVNTQQAGNILDEAVQAGATRIDGVSFVASDDAMANAREQALREATQDAQKQADVVLSTLNLTRREIVAIQVNNAFAPPPPRPLLQAARMDAVEASTPVIGGEQQVEAFVTLQIRY
ncbi:MAG TPA: SIMPL domain-containing protein [Leptolyngbyaceae cyanobacterium]